MSSLLEEEPERQHECGHSCTVAPLAGRVTCRRRAPPGAGREVRRRRRERGEPGRASLYLGGSIPGGREDRELYGRIVSRLRRFGAELTEHVEATDRGARGEKAAGGDRLIHEQDLAWLQQAKEVAQPPLGIGYELGRAVARNKPVLCLLHPQSGRVLSATIRGAADGSQVQVWGYKAAEAAAVLDGYFATDPPERWLLP
ncbi:5-hydroxymethyl-dUMP N-hydrolase [Kogia breviceps]|uniref:5-hydroxymethyl-dUMP N-hydrolase n=1 Tax=Kogia breviceps TaxID=27615 RepID=UPI0027961D60|nr:2'-deoxynucleoside 5'-phosphate N-hydrolase 1 [Kogia breviceps]